MKKVLFVFVCFVLLAGMAWAADRSPAWRTHDQKFTVLTIGTGAPNISPDRAEAMTVVQYNGNYFVLDCGSRTVERLLTNLVDFSKIHMLLFTHLHSDHTTDFPKLMIYRNRFGGRELQIVGPPRTTQLFDFFRQFYRDDVLYRIMVHNDHDSIGILTGVKIRELKASNKFDFEGVKIETAEMVHTMYDLAYKFTADGKTIVVSGDTSYNENLVNLARGADILVMDGISIAEVLQGEAPVFKFQQDKIDGEVPKPQKDAGDFGAKSHATFDELLMIASKTNVKKIVLTHVSSQLRRDQVDKIIPVAKKRFEEAGYKGEVIIPEDGWEIRP